MAANSGREVSTINIPQKQVRGQIRLSCELPFGNLPVRRRIDAASLCLNSTRALVRATKTNAARQTIAFFRRIGRS